MKTKGWTLAATGIAAAAGLTAVAGAGPAGADDADPAVVASREAAAATPHPAGYTNPPPVTASGPTTTTGPRPLAAMGDLYYLSGVSTSGGYIEVSARDNPAMDKPGTLTTTLRVYGNAAAFRDGAGDLGLQSQFTCTGAGITGLTVGTSGFSVSGGPSSSTLTWPSLRNNTAVLRQYYTEDGHFRCKASNVSPAKFTRRGIASTNYKGTDTRAQDEYSFLW